MVAAAAAYRVSRHRRRRFIGLQRQVIADKFLHNEDFQIIRFGSRSSGELRSTCRRIVAPHISSLSSNNTTTAHKREIDSEI